MALFRWIKRCRNKITNTTHFTSVTLIKAFYFLFNYFTTHISDYTSWFRRLLTRWNRETWCVTLTLESLRVPYILISSTITHILDGYMWAVWGIQTLVHLTELQSYSYKINIALMASGRRHLVRSRSYPVPKCCISFSENLCLSCWTNGDVTTIIVPEN